MSTIRQLTWVSLVALAWGCATDKKPEPKAPEVATSAALPERDPLEEEMFKVGQMRELPVIRHVKMVKLDRPALADEVRAYVERETPKDAVEGQGAMLRLLGVLPHNFDYLEANIALMKEQLAGFYDPSRETMVLASDLKQAEAEATLLHELVHAFQDQHFELGKRLQYEALQGDRLAALHTLAEGDATSAMLSAALKEQGYDIDQLSNEMLAERMRVTFQSQSPDVPSIIKRAALTPYIDGLVFVNELRRSGGWKLVNKVWTDPPVSTEQLLHPEKHAAKEPWRSFAAPAAPAPGCEVVFEDVIGEQGLKVLFEEWVSPEDAAAAAEGWNGDRATVFRCGTEFSLFWRIAYDAPAEGARAIETFRAGIPHCRPALDQTARTVRQLKDHMVVVAREGSVSCSELTSWIDEANRVQ